MKKVYKVALNGEEEAQLQALISKGRTSARKLTRARILLSAHAGEKDAAIARALRTSASTVVPAAATSLAPECLPDHYQEILENHPPGEATRQK